MRLLRDNDWFDAISSESQYESEFQHIVVHKSNILFPEFHVLPFNLSVESEDGRRRPDLALIDHGYRYWWVVEIEMAHHSLYGHVLPQVEVFARGRYGTEHANYMQKKGANGGLLLDGRALLDMVKGAQPRVLVVVNQSVPNWVEPIRRFHALLAIVEVFRSARNQHIFRINGDYPTIRSHEMISACRLDMQIPSFLCIDSPAALGIRSGESLFINLAGKVTVWERLDTGNRVWLCPVNRNPLRSGNEYQIWKNEDGRFSSKQSRTKRSRNAHSATTRPTDHSFL